eukprot:scaffold121687_cov33-Phaeocystis_antarctica.AAC.1
MEPSHRMGEGPRWARFLTCFASLFEKSVCMFQAHVVGQERSGTDMLSLYGAESPDGRRAEVGTKSVCMFQAHVVGQGMSGDDVLSLFRAESQKGPPHAILHLHGL